MNHCIYVTCYNCGRSWCDRCESAWASHIKPNAELVAREKRQRPDPYYGSSCACGNPNVDY